ncbi:MAG: phage tail protein I [Ahrensia sp.]|nr:phage tail protein I [Ahrensia sp.]
MTRSKACELSTYVMNDAHTVPADLLPFMVREFSVEEFISTDLPDEFVRRFIANAYELHAKKGYVEGTRLGLRMLGVEVSVEAVVAASARRAKPRHSSGDGLSQRANLCR